jgi:membrane protein required for beta-lactamase induction
MKKRSIPRIIGWVALGLSALTALGLALGALVMVLWNWLMPSLFHLPAISFWQSVGVIVLCHLLFKGHLKPHPHADRHDDHARRFKEKVHAMIEKGDSAPLPEGTGT